MAQAAEPTWSSLPLGFASAESAAVPLHLVAEDRLDSWAETQTAPVVSWMRRIGFTGMLGQVHLIPAGEAALALMGYGTAEKRARSRFALAQAASALPTGTYALATDLPDSEAAEGALGWLLAGYRFDRYKRAGNSGAGTTAGSAPASAAARLVAPRGVDAHRIETIARGEALTRDLINTPAADMGPAELEAAARALADAHGASIEVTEGAALAERFPLIHTVGRAATRPPRLIDLRHGTEGPRLTLVGKGICFDTGGLNLKPGSAMGLMKKDMGGAATVLGLTSMILSLGLPLQLRVLIPAAENAVSGDAFRPGDVLRARDGKTIEVNNTDAEGRLVLADALALGAEESPDLMVSMATLTGAARVAVGPDLAPYYTDDGAVAAALDAGGAAVADPVWRMPFHAPYEAMIEPAIADLDNAPSGGFAGSITAALFLRRFTEGAQAYAHFDIYGWQPSAAPARPKGGVGQGARALLEALPRILDL
ncbi:MAG: leucyl aminopeptidase family protein [Pseudomonadota bacterium]